VTAGERLSAIWADISGHLQAMTILQVGINLALTVAIVIASFVSVWTIRKLARVAARRIPGPHTADRTVRATRVHRVIAWTARVLAGVIALILVCNVWGLDLLAWLTRGLGETFAGSSLRLLFLLIAAVAAFEVSGFLIGRLFDKVADNASEARRRAQLKTLGPLLEGVVQTTVIIVAVLMALGEIGVKIGPLLAGAGVVGIALGFGAQTLVKDFLTGIFLIVEDIVSVGDIVRIGDAGGLVEEMTLRTIRLRDFDGTLHVFPYGEAQVVHNLTKTFSYYVFNLSVSYGSDIDEALRIMKQVGQEMQADESFADKILEPIEVVGVDNLADSGVILKARIKTQPIQQWSVGREYNRRIKLAFDRAGVEIPFPHMKVVLPDQQLSELTGHAA
jgi:small conductance mechanosensitive channel